MVAFKESYRRASKASSSASLALLNPPAISFQNFKRLHPLAQRTIVANNRVINTDTYNRTMGELTRKEARPTKLVPIGKQTAKVLPPYETYTLQLRRGQFGYLIACGIEDLAQTFATMRITKAEVDFAKEYYNGKNIPFFNEVMWRWIAEKNGGKLPFTIRGVRDGTLMKPGEPFLTVSGPGELIAHFEHLFHRVFYPTLVATRARAIKEIIKDPTRFIEVGKRGAVTEEQHLIALKAMYVGGGFTLTSNDAGVEIFPLKDIGTLGHRYIQRFKKEECAFRFAIENLPAVTLLVDLIDTYKGLDRALQLKKEYRALAKPIFVRVDSGDVLKQTLYYLQKAKMLGFTDSRYDKIVVEGIDSIEEIAAIEDALVTRFGAEALKLVVYGAGGLLISQNTTRSDASTGLKLSEYTDEEGRVVPSLKLSNSKGKSSYPGAPEVMLTRRGRVVAQPGELPHSLFESLYSNGRLLYLPESESLASKRAEEMFAKYHRGRKQTATSPRLSPVTRTMMRHIRQKYGVRTNL